MTGLCCAASGSIGGGAGLASGEAFEEPFEPGHALAQIGDIAAHVTKLAPHADDARADDGDEKSDGIDVHPGTVAHGGRAPTMEAVPGDMSERERVR